MRDPNDVAEFFKLLARLYRYFVSGYARVAGLYNPPQPLQVLPLCLKI